MPQLFAHLEPCLGITLALLRHHVFAMGTTSEGGRMASFFFKACLSIGVPEPMEVMEPCFPRLLVVPLALLDIVQVWGNH
jgi:hypothetical protein